MPTKINEPDQNLFLEGLHNSFFNFNLLR